MTFAWAQTEAVRAEDYVHRRVPMVWYRLYDELQSLLSGGQSTVTFTQALALAQMAGLPPWVVEL